VVVSRFAPKERATLAWRDIFLNMPVEVCEGRMRLADAVAKAAQEVHAARSEQARSVKDGAALARTTVRLARARKEERDAIAALDQHCKEHCC
jgi:hypothetical protein